MKKADREYMDRVSKLGCCVCTFLHGEHDPAEVELHHIRSNGWGRGGAETVLPICAGHHRLGPNAIHVMGVKRFEREIVSQQVLLDWVKEQLA